MEVRYHNKHYPIRHRPTKLPPTPSRYRGHSSGTDSSTSEPAVVAHDAADEDGSWADAAHWYPALAQADELVIHEYPAGQLGTVADLGWYRWLH